MKQKLSIIIPTFERSKNLAKCLNAVFSSTFKSFEVIVVDDGSKNPPKLEGFKARVLRLPENKGQAVARNKGVKVANAPIIVFIDDDVIVRKDILQKIADSFEKNPEISAVSGNLDKECPFENACSQFKNLYMHYTIAKLPRFSSTLFTSICAIKKQVFEKIGGFNTQIKKSAGEDFELGKRLASKGFKVLFDNNLQVTHLKHYSLKKLLGDDFWRGHNFFKFLFSKKLFNYSARLNYSNKLDLDLGFLTGIPISGVIILSLFLSLASFNFVFLLALLLALFFVLNFNFLKFLFKQKGFLFAFKSFFLLIADLFSMGLGAFYSVFSK